MTEREGVTVLEWTAGSFSEREIQAIREAPLRITVNGRDLITLMCTGKAPEALAAGFLLTSGLIRGRPDIVSLDVAKDEDGFTAAVTLAGQAPLAPGWAVTSGMGKTPSQGSSGLPRLPAPSAPFVEPGAVLALARELSARSRLYHLTRGCHNASLCRDAAMLAFQEDIGRHNALDAILGQCLLTGLNTSRAFLLATGRIASEIVVKAVRGGIGAMVSTAVATTRAVELARQAGLTLIGNAEGERLWVYNDAGHLMRPGDGGAAAGK